jgi:hypothetical protein
MARRAYEWRDICLRIRRCKGPGGWCLERRELGSWHHTAAALARAVLRANHGLAGTEYVFVHVVVHLLDRRYRLVSGLWDHLDPPSKPTAMTQDERKSEGIR